MDDAGAVAGSPSIDDSSRGIASRTAAYWFGTALTLAGSLARGKILAVALGTSGVGIFAQLLNVATILTGVATLGLSSAGITLLGRARANADTSAHRKIVSTIVAAPIVAAVVLTVATIALARPVSSAALGTPKYGWYIVLSALSVPANAVIAGYQIVMQGHGRALRTAANSALIAIATSATVALLVVPFGIAGAAWSIVATSVVAALIVVSRERWIGQHVLPVASAGKSANRMLLRFGAASLLAGTATTLVDLVLRSGLTHRLGDSANGLYQPAYLLGNVLLVQLGGGVAAAVTPGVATAWARNDRAGVAGQLRAAVRLSLLAMVPAVLLAMAARGILVPAVFSGAFKNAEPVLALQLTSEVPRAIAYAMGSMLLPAGMVRAWITMGLAAETLRLVLGLGLLPVVGINALAIASLADWSFIAITTAILVWRSGVNIGAATARLAFLASLVVGGAYALTRSSLSQLASGVVMMAAAAAWVIMIVDATEFRVVRDRGFRVLTKVRTWRPRG